jgi:predicted sulfurtransferase
MTILNPDDPIMIGLYYCYLDMQHTLAEHLKFQEKLCKDLSLFGRIRVSPEGINGVLSGSSSNLKEYERFLSIEIENILSKESDASLPTRYGNTLDIKYCHLRPDIPIEKQVFTNLSVKATKEVVSLNDGTAPNSSQLHKKRGRNKQRNNVVKDAVIKVNDFEPAIHLTPYQWNQELMQSQNDSDAILIDARNCYESAVGHFKVDGLPTLLTNTRKYSTISDVLKANANTLSGKKVMMYCTGGVRCERASSYLLALAESDEWPKGVDKPKAVYQLQGGIQKYLEAFGTTEDGSRRQILRHDSDKELDDTTGPCLYAGRNFVFDPRRIDPVVGISGKAVGRCVLCLTPHDDYDNGFAPSEEKEARCCRCRVLVLVCNTCRERVRIWGEEKSTLEDSKPDLYCGGKGECMNEGNEVEHCTLVQY